MIRIDEARAKRSNHLAAYFGVIDARARAFIQQYRQQYRQWDQIETLAEELLRRASMSGEEVVAAIKKHAQQVLQQRIAARGGLRRIIIIGER